MRRVARSDGFKKKIIVIQEQPWWLLLIFPGGINEKDNTNSNNKEKQIIAHAPLKNEEGAFRTNQIFYLPFYR